MMKLTISGYFMIFGIVVASIFVSNLNQRINALQDEIAARERQLEYMKQQCAQLLSTCNKAE